ncbi:MAG: MBOAT family protein, partial [Methylobacter sp.]
MLFNSPEFIYFFLPFSIAAWWGLQRINRGQDAQRLVIICSVYFYGWWDTRYVPLLIGNTLINFYLGQKLSQTRSKALLMAGLVYNIGLLGYFKYVDFFHDNWNALAGSQRPLLHRMLPLGISFFTFQVIAYLVDCYKGRVGDFNLRRFAFSISFFPHFIAGPILHYSDVMPQL